MRSSNIWVTFGIMAWALGFIRVGVVKKIDLEINKSFVRPPFLVYLICGMPRSRNIPKGVMAIPAVMLQLHGLFWIAYGVVSAYLPIQSLILQGTFVFSGIALIMVYGLKLYKNNRYEIGRAHV